MQVEYNRSFNRNTRTAVPLGSVYSKVGCVEEFITYERRELEEQNLGHFSFTQWPIRGQ
jgi:hypothetical protein